jgi:hypothetical protein
MYDVKANLAGKRHGGRNDPHTIAKQPYKCGAFENRKEFIYLFFILIIYFNLTFFAFIFIYHFNLFIFLLLFFFVFYYMYDVKANLAGKRHGGRNDPHTIAKQPYKCGAFEKK